MEGKEREPYPTEILRDKYVDMADFCEENNIDIEVVRKLISDRKINYTEFMKRNSKRRSIHINPEEVFPLLGGE